MTKLSENGNIEIDDTVYDLDDIIGMIKIQTQLLIEENTLYTIEECINIWQNYSWALQASWLFVDEEGNRMLQGIRLCSGFVSFEEWSKID